MQAMIIAAGFGSRLSALFEPKPLAPIGGRAMIELAIGQAALAGAEEVAVVTGHMADELEAALPAFAQAAGIPVKPVRTGDWSCPNGYSVLAGAAHMRGPYLLMMADHLFSSTILKNLAQETGADRGVTLAIDRRIDHRQLDKDDATWVQADRAGLITAIGKNISQYNAVDCGAFLATEELALAIASAIEQGKSGSLSDGMQILADKKRAGIMDIGEAWWLDVDDPPSHALAQEQAPAQMAEVFDHYARGQMGRAIADDLAKNKGQAAAL